MDMLFAWILTLTLGFDALIVSASLGLSKEPKDKVTIALVIASVESLMPIAGMIIGGALGSYFNGAITAIGALLLLGVAIYFLLFDRDEEKGKPFDQQLSGWPLIAVAIGISLDELAVGFTAGMMQAPLAIMIAMIACQSFAFSMIGVLFGARLKRYLGEWAEKASGIVLGLLGVWMLIEEFAFR